MRTAAEVYVDPLQYGSCLQGDPDRFFPISDFSLAGRAQIERAIEECRWCPVLQACKERVGRLSVAERKKLFTGQVRAAVYYASKIGGRS